MTKYTINDILYFQVIVKATIMVPASILKQLKHNFCIDIDSLINDIKKYLPNVNASKITDAFIFSVNAHDGQLRKSGQPYIIHPYQTAVILASLRSDEDTIIAGLLHDVPEDTDQTLLKIEEKFGPKVSFLVDGITKLSKVHYQHEMQERHIESLKKLFIHTAKDPRIILIKLADRLHNMRTLEAHMNMEKITRISRETLEVFVPIANLLGIEEVKTELETLCFKYLYSDQYKIISDRINSGMIKNQETINNTIDLINTELSKQKISCEIEPRTKNVYHIYKRSGVDNAVLNEYDNMIAIRIIVDSKEDCYKTLGIIHGLFKPRLSSFRDFISLPKKNGYQSLHTTVFGLNGLLTEYQIRSKQMHIEAEYGILSHNFDNCSSDYHIKDDERSKWAKKIIQLQKFEQNTGVTDFMDNLREDILHERIFVFTPKGFTVDLPKDATCIDFAYEIHTEIGNRAINAEINGKVVPMTTKLKNSDTVNIITSDIAKGPSRSWLAFVKTNTAKSRILEYFKKISKEDKIITGKKMLQKELDWAGLGMISDIPHKKIKDFCKNKKNCSSLDDILKRIGEGTFSSLDFVNCLYPNRDKSSGKIWLFAKRKLSHKGTKEYSKVSLKIVGRDMIGQMRKILREIAEQNINIIYAKGYVSFWTGELVIKVVILVENYPQVSQVCEIIEHVDGVRVVLRGFLMKKILFSIAIALTFLIWASHPYILHYLSSKISHESNPLLSSTLLYAGTFMLFLTVLVLKRFTQRSFPEIREMNSFWMIIFLLIFFAVITLFAEVYFFALSFDWLILLGLVLLSLAYLSYEYFNYRRK